MATAVAEQPLKNRQRLVWAGGPRNASAISRAGLALLFAGSFFWWMPDYWLFLSAQAAVFTVAVLSVMVLQRATPSMSLCQASLMGIGAYMTAWLSSSNGWGFVPAAIIGVLVVVPVGMILAIPALRLRGLELSVLTLCVSLAATAIVFDPLAPLKFSDRGAPLSGPARPFGLDLSSAGRMYLFQLVLAAAAVGAVWLLLRSPLGMTWQAMRAGNAAAAAAGIPVAGMQMIGFAASAGLAGLAGVMLLSLQGTVTSASFSPTQSVFLVVIAALFPAGRVGFAPLGGLVVGLGHQLATTFGISGEWVDALFGFWIVLHILTVAIASRGTGDAE